jgi:hypothetical protein
VGDPVGHDSLVAQLGAVEQFADLGDARVAEIAVEVPRERPQKRDAFESEQVRQRVLVDHHKTVTSTSIHRDEVNRRLCPSNPGEPVRHARQPPDLPPSERAS